MLPVFQELSDLIGRERVVWRYDPILFTDKYSVEYHLKAFRQIAEALKGYTDKCVISFVDRYAKNRKAMETLHIQEKSEADLKEVAIALSKIARENSMEIAACAETIDLTECGVVHNSCIDKELIEKLIGCKLKVSKDKNQRLECGCVESIEVGTYDTCRNGCVYCYANNSQSAIDKNCQSYDVNSPILCGRITEKDKITERKVASLKDEQMMLWE